MQKVIVYSTTTEGINHHLSVLELKQSALSTVVKTESALLSRLEEKVFHLGLIDVKIFDSEVFNLIENLRRKKYKLPFLVLSHAIHPDFVNFYVKGEKQNASALEKTLLDQLSPIYFLQKPFSEKSFLGLTRKLLIIKNIPQQRFQRFRTNQLTEIESLTSGDTVLSSMYNLSQGGAYCEFDSYRDLPVGDLLKVRVHLNEVQAQHSFNAKVVWTTPKGNYSGRFGCGLKFINPKEVPKLLLMKN